MKHNKLIIALAAGGLLAATNLMAQGTTQPPAAQSQVPTDHYGSDTQSSPAYQGQTFKASSLIGLPVRNDTGERLGKVQDLIITMNSRSVPYAIVEYGGTLGIGQIHVAVPLKDLKYSAEPKQMVLTATRAEFEAASSAPTGGWLAVAGEDWVKNVDRFYGQPAPMSTSRFERQESSGTGENREAVRNPADQKVTPDLQDLKSDTTPDTSDFLVKPTDLDLIDKVNSLIRQDVGDQAKDIQVTIKNGVVTLRGKIGSAAQKHVLEDQIKNLPGVDRVQNVLITE